MAPTFPKTSCGLRTSGLSWASLYLANPGAQTQGPALPTEAALSLRASYVSSRSAPGCWVPAVGQKPATLLFSTPRPLPEGGALV